MPEKVLSISVNWHFKSTHTSSKIKHIAYNIYMSSNVLACDIQPAPKVLSSPPSCVLLSFNGSGPGNFVLAVYTCELPFVELLWTAVKCNEAKLPMTFLTSELSIDSGCEHQHECMSWPEKTNSLKLRLPLPLLLGSNWKIVIGI